MVEIENAWLLITFPSSNKMFSRIKLIRRYSSIQFSLSCLPHAQNTIYFCTTKPFASHIICPGIATNAASFQFPYLQVCHCAYPIVPSLYYYHHLSLRMIALLSADAYKF
ncbi:hypothetical protein CDL12_07907 [Handroanthus impetiginosus]|uniref:Uncharacterized protein n=1 Tax=Handroanthus impetiginosus TaxID=429701 RepID=A0A2G9HPN3_9LAMI|nr:hypothetical protein CDL12_07907 [Handroanthus impetiginosus]